MTDSGDGTLTLLVDFLLNFEETEGPVGFAYADDEAVAFPTDGDDRIFGDLDNDWLVGGTGRDRMYGGRGSDMLNMDDNHDSGAKIFHPPPKKTPGDPLENTLSDEYQAYADIAYGGAGRDVLILNTGADRAIDWVGEFNSYIVPFSPFGAFHNSRTLQPQLEDYLEALSESDGADVRVDPAKMFNAPDGQLYVQQKLADVRTDDPDPDRNYEPFGELGMVRQEDRDWQEQTGPPADPQPGNLQGQREIMRRELFTDSDTAIAFAADVGAWTVAAGEYEAVPAANVDESVSIFHLDQYQPTCMEILATVNVDKDKAGWKSNAYVLFDFQSYTDFKFMGIDVGLDKLRIGHRTVDGWVVDAQGVMQLKDHRDYDLTGVLFGSVATIWVDGERSLSFDFGEALNDGLLGLGTDGAVARFDDYQVQKLPPELTFEVTEDFSDPQQILLSPQTGDWQAIGGDYTATVIDGSEMALATTFWPVVSYSFVELETQVQSSQTAGIVFDHYDIGEFKFAAISADADQIVIGHYASHGWRIDASAAYDFQDVADHTLSVSLLGSGVSVAIDGQPVVGHTFNSILNDGDFGLLVRDGTGTFDGFVIRGDDPAYSQPVAAMSVDAIGSQYDTNQDGMITPIDALLIINWLNSSPSSEYAALADPLLDVDRNGYIVALDALLVINELNSARNTPRNAPIHEGNERSTGSTWKRTVDAVDALIISESFTELGRRSDLADQVDDLVMQEVDDCLDAIAADTLISEESLIF